MIRLTDLLEVFLRFLFIVGVPIRMMLEALFPVSLLDLLLGRIRLESEHPVWIDSREMPSNPLPGTSEHGLLQGSYGIHEIAEKNSISYTLAYFAFETCRKIYFYF